MARTAIWITWPAALGVALLLYVSNAWLGPLNQDEGWYLYAARMVSEGQWPFIDFAYTQGPVLPLVYQFALGLVERFGLLGGRIFTGCLGFAACLLAAVLAGRLAGKANRHTAALIAFIVCAVNVYQAYFGTIVKTYSLCSVFLLLGLLALVRAVRKPMAMISPSVAALFLVLAAGTRLSAGIALPIAGLYLLCRRRSLGDAAWILFGTIGLGSLAVVFFPFFIGNSEALRFGLFEYHGARFAGSGFDMLVYKGGFISRVTQAYFVSLVLFLLMLLLRWKGPQVEGGEADNERGVRLLIWSVVLGISLVHFIARFPYDDYQAMVFPLFAAVLAPGLLRELDRISDRAAPLRALLPLFLLLVCTASSFSSQVNQDWFVIRRDTVWWRMKSQPDLARLRAAAERIKLMSGEADTLFTQDTYLAVEAELRVPEGMEMGVFCYYPDLSAERAAQLKVLDHPALLKAIRESAAPVAALTDYSFAIASPHVERVSDQRKQELEAAFAERYEAVKTMEDFGQGHTPLRLFKLRAQAADAEQPAPVPAEPEQVPDGAGQPPQV